MWALSELHVRRIRLLTRPVLLCVQVRYRRESPRAREVRARDHVTLERRIDEFIDIGYPGAGSLRVLPSDDEDTGLIKLELCNASTTTVIHPPGDNETA